MSDQEATVAIMEAIMEATVLLGTLSAAEIFL